MNNHFLSWFSGFMDGEGYFGILPNNKGKSYMAQASIKLRADDTGILEKIAKNTGIGRVYKNMPSQYHRKKDGNLSIQAKWQVADMEGCLKLIDIFDNFPLLAKKARVYRLWRRAVLHMKKHGKARCAKIDEIMDEMKAQRKDKP